MVLTLAKLIDLTGQRFEKLTVIKRVEDKIYKGGRKFAQYLCKCDCGNTVKVTAANLRNGYVKSCGCYRKEIVEKHGQCGTRLYRVWSDMKQRCKNQNGTYYHIYGGKGISVCDEWQEFDNFYKWAIENGYKDELTIDRIDSNSNYEPSNCRWATQKEQQNNKSNNHLITYNGKTQTMKQWAEELDINYSTLVGRIVKHHWEIEKALTTKVVRGRNQWAKS